MNEDGFIKIVDRKKEMINVSGFNVYPNEIEEVVSSHDKVLEVGAIGVTNEKSTEVVKIYVVKERSFPDLRRTPSLLQRKHDSLQSTKVHRVYRRTA